MNAALLLWFVAFLPFVPFTLQSVSREPECPCNQTATECTPCDQFCNQEPRICTDICIINSTCRCDDGYFRVDENSKQCVLQEDCPPPQPPQCPSNQTATECTPCDQFCNQEPRACTKICIKNSTCRCDDGYFRIDENSKQCVLQEDCPPPQPPQCPCNQTATSCIPCNQVCNEEPRFCALACIENATFCQCDSGYKLINANSSECVLEADCPPPPNQCPVNQTATNCQPCNSVCNLGPRPCPRVCTENATFCQCDSGYELTNETSGECVLQEDCPKPDSCTNPGEHCEPGEVYTTCGSCDRSCRNLNPICTLQCRVGCYCAEGNVRNEAGKCIPESECPNEC